MYAMKFMTDKYCVEFFGESKNFFCARVVLLLITTQNSTKQPDLFDCQRKWFSRIFSQLLSLLQTLLVTVQGPKFVEGKKTT